MKAEPAEVHEIDVMVTDDEDVFRANISRLLLARGFSVDTAASAPQCLEKLKEHPAKTVIMDVKMPQMTGLEALGPLLEHHPDTRVILLTGNASAEDGVAGIKAGAFDYLSKPIEIGHLEQKIRQAMDHRRLQAEQEKQARIQKALEKQLEASARLASLGTFAMGVAHEINNPLAVIRQSLYLIQLKTKGKATADMDFLTPVLGRVENAVERVRRITHQLLGFVRQQGAPVLEISLQDLMEDAVASLQQTIEEKEIRIIRDIPGPPVKIQTRPYQLRQAVVNILGNAVQASPDRGEVRLLIRTRDNQVDISIQDSGPGIAPDVKEKIFEPFFTTKTDTGGKGLGLFITNRLISDLGGTIQVDSPPEKGARFVICLPVGEAGGGNPEAEDGGTA